MYICHHPVPKMLWRSLLTAAALLISVSQYYSTRCSSMLRVRRLHERVCLQQHLESLIDVYMDQPLSKHCLDLL